MADEVWAWCEKAQAFGSTITVKVKYADFRQATRSRTFQEAIGSQDALRAASLALIRTVFPVTIGVRLVGVTLSNFRGDRQAPIAQLDLGWDCLRRR
jgi:DNA polymerase-4